MVEIISLIGLSAGIIAIFGYLPQIHKSFSLRKMDEVSAWLMILFMTSSFLWMIYGIYKDDMILAGLSTVTFLLAMTLIIMKMIYEKKISSDFLTKLISIK